MIMWFHRLVRLIGCVVVMVLGAMLLLPTQLEARGLHGEAPGEPAKDTAIAPTPTIPIILPPLTVVVPADTPVAEPQTTSTPKPTATIPIILPPLTVVVPVDTPAPTPTPTAWSGAGVTPTPTLELSPPGPEPPNEIPEAGTLLLLGGGLVGVVGYLQLQRQGRRSKTGTPTP